MRYHTIIYISIGILLYSFLSGTHAGQKDFHNGKVIAEFGQIASVDADMKIPKGSGFKVLFDTAKGAEAGSVNNTLNTAARFLNMHGEAGVPEEKMQLAIVFHGKASFDLLNDASYGKKFDGADNTSANLVKALKETGVRIILCGQSATYHNVAKENLLPGVELALSAMTAHALLQQDGYTLNPF